MLVKRQQRLKQRRPIWSQILTWNDLRKSVSGYTHGCRFIRNESAELHVSKFKWLWKQYWSKYTPIVLVWAMNSSVLTNIHSSRTLSINPWCTVLTQSLALSSSRADLTAYPQIEILFARPLAICSAPKYSASQWAHLRPVWIKIPFLEVFRGNLRALRM